MQTTCCRCNGKGYQVWDEDGILKEDVCYLCAGEGLCDERVTHTARLASVAAHMAMAKVARLRESYNAEAEAEAEGEDWAFCAAEHQLSERDYTQMRVWEAEEQFQTELEKLSHDAQVSLIEAIQSLLPSPVIEPKTPPPASDDDLPF